MSKRILVIEDQLDNRQILRDLLTSAEFEVIEAENGEDGVAAAVSQRPDLILMDIQLPLLDGYEATRRIKAETTSCRFRLRARGQRHSMSNRELTTRSRELENEFEVAIPGRTRTKVGRQGARRGLRGCGERGARLTESSIRPMPTAHRYEPNCTKNATHDHETG